VSPESGAGDGAVRAAPGVLDHPSHLLSRAARGGNDEVALVLAGLVVHHDNEFPARYGCDGALHRVESKGRTDGRGALFRGPPGRRGKVDGVVDRTGGCERAIGRREWEESDWCHDCSCRQTFEAVPSGVSRVSCKYDLARDLNH
jgi:hypothetical protein